jgi:hypothetical protein
MLSKLQERLAELEYQAQAFALSGIPLLKHIREEADKIQQEIERLSPRREPPPA